MLRPKVEPVGMVSPCTNILPPIGSDFWQIISQWERRPSSLTLTGPQYENLMRFMNSHSVDHRSGSSLFSIPMMRTIDLICSLDHILRSNQLRRQCWNSKSRENCTSKWDIFNICSILKSLIMARSWLLPLSISSTNHRTLCSTRSKSPHHINLLFDNALFSTRV